MNIKKIAAAAVSVSLATAMALGGVACTTPTDTPSAPTVNPAAPENTYTYDIPQDYNRTYYELFVRSFADGNGDGIGDFRGLIDNLDYLNDGDPKTTDDLGINGLWLMPINQSPSYHKYDVEDYYDIDDEYGDLGDFDELVRECDKRGIWLQMDLVINHTSNRHPWFKEAIADALNGVDPADSVSMQRYNIIKASQKPAGDQYIQLPGAIGYYFLSSFKTSSMPDLNLSNTEVREEIKRIVDFWLERGVRSFRLDAVPWAMGDSTNDPDETGEFWTWFNNYCNEKGRQVYGERYPGLSRYCYNVGEVWAGNSQIEAFFGTGMSNFNYDIADSATHGYIDVANCRDEGGASGLVASLESIQTGVLAKDSNAILSNFLSNHDNLRSGGKLSLGQEYIKSAAALYLLSPGNPYIYYGEEIGAVSGNDKDNDPNKRLPFNWGDGSSRIVTRKPDGANFSGEQKNGTWLQQNTDQSSILTFYRQAIQLRNRFPEISHGVINGYGVNADGKLIAMDEEHKAKYFNGVNNVNKTVAAYTLTYGERKVLILHNLVKGEEASIDISDFAGYKLEGTLIAKKGGTVSLDGSTLKLSGGTVAVLKA